MKAVLFLLLFLVNSANSQENSQLMLMGTFHFANPGLDSVKTDVIDVMTKDNQEYLDTLAQRISEFEPTSVLLEFNPKNTEAINEKYQKYLQGEFDLPVNEIFQIGFRVAKLSGVKRIESLDERSLGWDAENLFKYMETTDHETNDKMKALIQQSTETMDWNQKNLSLKEILQLNNSTEYDTLNKNLYLATNAVGVGENLFYGADASASWWHRNFRIYAKIQHQAKTNKRIFALAGQGHTAIIKDLVKSDLTMDLVPTSF